MQVPDIHYTKVDGLSIAWQQWGSGPDVLVIPGLVTNIEPNWEHEFYHRVSELLGKHIRMTVFDKRGMGLSERTQEHQTVEQRMTDVLAVMDAAGLDRTHLLAISEGGLIAQMFAARNPERVNKCSSATPRWQAASLIPITLIDQSVISACWSNIGARMVGRWLRGFRRHTPQTKRSYGGARGFSGYRALNTM